MPRRCVRMPGRTGVATTTGRHVKPAATCHGAASYGRQPSLSVRQVAQERVDHTRR